MRISGNSNTTTIYKPFTKGNNLAFNAQAKAQTRTNQSIYSEDIYEQLSKDYNIRNASHEQVCEISRILYNQGEISLFEHGRFTFKLELPQYPNYRYFLTEADQCGKRDWIAEYDARIQQDKKIGNTQGYMQNKKMMEVLMRLEKK